MKGIFKKTLFTIGLVSVMATTVNAVALDNEIIITGTVADSAVVGFSDVSAEAAAVNRFVGVDVALGSVLPGGTWGAQTFPIFVKSNSATGISMKVDDAAAAAGVLQGPGANIAVAYELGTAAAAYTVDSGTPVSLTAGATLGNEAATRWFKVTPAATAAAQTVGTYAATLNVTIAVN